MTTSAGADGDLDASPIAKRQAHRSCVARISEHGV